MPPSGSTHLGISKCLCSRSVVGRRCFFLIGTLYMYRCITMYITTLPVPGKHMVCAPKVQY